MAKAAERITRAIEFWRNKRPHRLLLTEPTINILKKTSDSLDKKKRFGMGHIQALSLAVSLFEAQMRDCLRLRVDDLNSELDYNSEFLDIKIDSLLLDEMRSHRLTLGEFVFINTGIPTIEKLWRAIEFCFPFDISHTLNDWLSQKAVSLYSIDDLKSSLAWVYIERNKFTHEFFDSTAKTIQTFEQREQFQTNISRAYEFLMFVQELKRTHFVYELEEGHPSWGATARKINRANARIAKLIEGISDFIQSIQPADSTEEIQAERLRASFFHVLSIYEEWIEAIVTFSYSSFWPGTARNDVATFVRLDELRRFKQRLKRYFATMQQVFGTGAEAEAIVESKS